MAHTDSHDDRYRIYPVPGSKTPVMSVEERRASPTTEARCQPQTDLDKAMIAALTLSPPSATVELTFRAREHALAEIFSDLSPAEAHAMKQRLTAPREQDAVAVQFARFSEERRGRLITFLVDTQRRAARRAARVR